MEITLMISLSAPMTMVAAQSTTVIGEAALDINYDNPATPWTFLPRQLTSTPA
ncbi:hypothetical protein BGX20_005956, partial [Mortierella sp. AD010]